MNEIADLTEKNNELETEMAKVDAKLEVFRQFK
jgi:hypothetical protein